MAQESPNANQQLLVAWENCPTPPKF